MHLRPALLQRLRENRGTRILSRSPARRLRYPNTRRCLAGPKPFGSLAMSESTQTWVMVADAHGANVFAYVQKTDPSQPIQHLKEHRTGAPETANFAPKASEHNSAMHGNA